MLNQVRQIKPKRANGINGSVRGSRSKFPQVSFTVESDLLDIINKLAIQNQVSFAHQARILLRRGLASEGDVK